MLFLTTVFTDTTGQGRSNKLGWEWTPLISHVATTHPRGWGWPTIGAWTRFVYPIASPADKGASFAWNRLQLANFDQRGCALRFDMDEVRLLVGSACIHEEELPGGEGNKQCTATTLDVNGDGAVDVLDLNALAANITASGGFSYDPTAITSSDSGALGSADDGTDGEVLAEQETQIGEIAEAVLRLADAGQAHQGGTNATIQGTPVEELVVSPAAMAASLPDPEALDGIEQ